MSERHIEWQPTMNLRFVHHHVPNHDPFNPFAGEVEARVERILQQLWVGWPQEDADGRIYTPQEWRDVPSSWGEL